MRFEVELLDFHGEDITKDKDGGVTKRTLEQGEGLDHPNEESQVEIRLRGELFPSGKVFDERDLALNLGEGAEHGVPRGVELAVEKMKKGERARVTVAPSYAFGVEGDASRQIPPNATLDYEIQLKYVDQKSVRCLSVADLISHMLPFLVQIV